MFRLMVSGSAALPTPVLEQWREVTGHTLLGTLFKNFLCLAPSVPDPHVFGPPRSGSTSQRYGSGSGFFYNQAKIVRKTLIPTVLLLLLDFLSL
jgi:hypothetical protein